MNIVTDAWSNRRSIDSKGQPQVMHQAHARGWPLFFVLRTVENLILRLIIAGCAPYRACSFPALMFLYRLA